MTKTKIANLICLCLIFFLIGLYLVQINSQTEENFRLQEVDKNLKNLQKENHQLGVEISRLRSLSRVQSYKVGDAKMVSLRSPKFLDISKPEVAQAR